MLFAGGHAALHSWHCLPPPPAIRFAPASGASSCAAVPLFAVGQQFLHLARVALRHHTGLAQRAIACRILLAAILRARALQVHILAATRDGDALRGGFMRLQLKLWHRTNSGPLLAKYGSEIAGVRADNKSPATPRTELV